MAKKSTPHKSSLIPVLSIFVIVVGLFVSVLASQAKTNFFSKAAGSITTLSLPVLGQIRIGKEKLPPRSSEILYTYVDIGSLGGNWTVPISMSESGLLAGYSKNSSGIFRAFYWDGTLKSVPVAAGYENCSSYATSTSSSGKLLVGFYNCSESQTAFKYYLSDEKLELLKSLDSGQSASASSVNDDGWVIGTSGNKAVLWNPSGDISNLDKNIRQLHTYSLGKDINDSLSMLADSDIKLPPLFLQNSLYSLGGNSSFLPIPLLAYSETGLNKMVSTGLSSKNFATGYLLTEGNPYSYRGFTYTLNDSRSFRLLTGFTGYNLAYSTNNNKQTVGQFTQTISHGALWENGKSYDLNTITKEIPPNTTINALSSINSRGDTAGICFDSSSLILRGCFLRRI